MRPGTMEFVKCRLVTLGFEYDQEAGWTKPGWMAEVQATPLGYLLDTWRVAKPSTEEYDG